jgi:hypothetical protein
MPRLEYKASSLEVAEAESAQYRSAYDAIIKIIDKETLLISYRNSWAIFLSGGLLATEGVIVERLQEGSAHYSLNGALLFLNLLLSFFGFIFCYKSKEGISAAHAQIHYLMEEYEKFQDWEGQNLFQNIYKLPRPFGERRTHSAGNVTALIFPRMMIVVWGVLGFVELCGAVWCFWQVAPIGN